MSDSTVLLIFLAWFLIGLAGLMHEVAKLLRRAR